MLHVDVHVELLPLGSILVAHRQEVEALALLEHVPILAAFGCCWRHNGEAGVDDDLVLLIAATLLDGACAKCYSNFALPQNQECQSSSNCTILTLISIYIIHLPTSVVC